jgi:hypothetical protein
MWRGLGLTLGLLLALLCLGVIYLNLVGFPQFTQTKLKARLEARGIELNLERLKLRGISRLQVGHLVIAPAENAPGSPHLALEGIEIELSYSRLMGSSFQPRSARFQRATLVWPFLGASESPAFVTWEMENGEIQWPSENVIRMAPAKGWMNGAETEISATLTNLAKVRDWGKRPSEVSAGWDAALHNWARVLEFESPSVMRLSVSGDALEPESLRMGFDLESARMATPLGEWGELRLQLELGFSQSNAETLQGAFTVEWAGGQFSNGHAGAGTGEGKFEFSLGERSLKDARWRLMLDEWEGGGAQLQRLEMTGHTIAWDAEGIRTDVELALGRVQVEAGMAAESRAHFQIQQSNPAQIPDQVNWRWASRKVETRWGTSEEARFSGGVRRTGPLVEKRNEDWGYWSYLAPFEMDWNGEVAGLHSPEFEVGWMGMEGKWRSPELSVETFQARLYGGAGEASARLNVATRRVHAEGEFDFDVHGVSSLLTANSKRWLSQFSWEQPPRVKARAGLILPPWDDSQKQWRQDVLPTLTLDGCFQGSGGAFRGIAVSAASSDFQLTNLVWELPNLIVSRPEGESTIHYRGDMATQNFAWKFRSQADPRVAKTFLSESQQEIFNLVEFNETPRVEGEVWGRWGAPEVIGFSGSVEARDFLFRGERCDHLRAGLQFTNLLLHLTEVQIQRDAQKIEAPQVVVDFAAELIYVSNTVSSFDPGLVTKVIGPKVHQALQPYYFHQPPDVRVDGVFPIRDLTQADVHFEVAAREFSFWKFNVPYISGSIWWEGEKLSLSEVRASFYDGLLEWEGNFDFAPPLGADFRFRGSVSEAELKLLMNDLLPENNRELAGRLNGNFVLSPSNTADADSWRGSGNISLDDGFLWDIPIFGFFSEVLNRIAPGLGNSPVSSGSARFFIDGEVVSTRNLELRSPALRLAYQGHVTFDGEVEARMEAEILRDAVIFGRVLSRLFRPLTKAFEYRITGTIFAPESEPIHFPKAFMRLFRPIRTLRDLFSREEANAPVRP